MTSYRVVAGIVRQGNAILLVKQQGPDDDVPAWSLPGGVVSPGESLSDGLTRECREETGLMVCDVGSLAYIVHLTDNVEEIDALVHVFEVLGWRGAVAPADPDEHVTEARFVDLPKAVELLAQQRRPMMREPIVAYLSGQSAVGTGWVYRRSSDSPEMLTDRLSPRAEEG